MPLKSLWVIAFVCAATVLAAPAARKSALDKPAMEEYVRRLFIWGPQIQVKVEDPKPSKTLPGFLDVAVVASSGPASMTEYFYVSKDGQKIIRGDVYSVDRSPFEADEAKLNTAGAPTFGKPGAPIKIVVFSDFECGYCKEESKVLRDNIKGEYADKVQVFYMDFPLEAIHPWAMTAALAGRCILREKPDAYWSYHDYMFEHQAEITADNAKQKILEFASAHSLPEAPLNSCLETRATAAEVAHNQEVGKSLRINSTPTIFVNGRKIPGGIPWPNLQQVIEFEVDYRKTHPDVNADKCCEITLPSPLNK